MNEKTRPSDLFKMACEGDVGVLKKYVTDTSFHIDTSDTLNKTALWFAVGSGEEIAVKTLLEAGANINKRHRSMQTVLMLAVDKGNSNMTNLLIQCGAELDNVDAYGMTAAMIATQNNHIECLKLLVSHRCNLEVKDIRGKTALILAIDEGHPDCLETLIRSGASLQSIDYNGGTPLFRCILTCHSKCLKILIRSGIELNALDRQGRSAVMACINRELECLSTLILAGADVNLSDRKFRTPLIIAVKLQDFQAFSLLIQEGANLDIQDYHGNTALMRATKAGLVSYLDLLLQGGANTQLRNFAGKSALDLAVLKRNDNCLNCLLFNTHNFNVNAQCNLGRTALMYACSLCDEHLIKMLIHSGSNVNLKDFEGKTALMYLVDKYDVRKKVKTTQQISSIDVCVTILLNAGADVNSCDLNGRTALMLAAAYSDSSLDTLLTSGANISALNAEGRNVLFYAASNQLHNHIEFLVERGGDIHLPDKNNETLLMYVIKLRPHTIVRMNKHVRTAADVKAELYFISMLETVLRCGSDIHMLDKTCTSAFMYAIKYSLDFPQLQLLLNYGADINVVNKHGHSALSLSISTSQDCESLVRFLLEHGADPNIGMYEGKSPFSLGIFYRNIAVLDLLSSHKMFKFQFEDIRYLIVYGEKDFLQRLISKGFTPAIKYSLVSDRRFSLIATSYHANAIGFLKYFLAVSYLTIHDTVKPPLNEDFSFTEKRWAQKVQREEICKLLDNFYSQPWPLSKLCFITVSSLLGYGNDRKERVMSCPLPMKLKSMLMFQEPVVKLCGSLWDSIPLYFDAASYESSSSPRPLLYYWPTGQRLVQCKNCKHCSDLCFRFL
ncbi:ankyrin repeat protein isoform X1 [Biomphalaria glabrata]